MRYAYLLVGLGLLLGACRVAPITALPVTTTVAPSPSVEGEQVEPPTTPITGPDPTATPTERATATMALAREVKMENLVITVVYDNNPYDPRLRTDWGFGALIEYQGHTVLLDLIPAPAGQS